MPSGGIGRYEEASARLGELEQRKAHIYAYVAQLEDTPAQMMASGGVVEMKAIIVELSGYEVDATGVNSRIEMLDLRWKPGGRGSVHHLQGRLQGAVLPRQGGPSGVRFPGAVHPGRWR